MITFEILNNKSILAFENVNKLNFMNIDGIADYLNKKFEETDKDLYLNLTGIKFIDSSAFEKLIAVHRFANSLNRKLKLFNASEELREIFLFTGIGKKLNIANVREVFEKQGYEYPVTYL